jgi:hypothetical protein
MATGSGYFGKAEKKLTARRPSKDKIKTKPFWGLEKIRKRLVHLRKNVRTLKKRYYFPSKEF